MYAFLDLCASLNTSWLNTFGKTLPQVQTGHLMHLAREGQHLLDRRTERTQEAMQSCAVLGDRLRDVVSIPGGLLGPAASSAWLSWSRSMVDASFAEIDDQMRWTHEIGQEVLAIATSHTDASRDSLPQAGREPQPPSSEPIKSNSGELSAARPANTA